MNIIKLDAIDSTNDYLKTLLSKMSVKNFTIVSANYQANGKGQMGSLWHSEKFKNLMCSIYLSNNYACFLNQFHISIVVSLAVKKSLNDFNIPKISIKWPNDIMSGNKKVCGVLIENLVNKNKIKDIIVGIGLNVNQTKFNNLPNASSLKNITGIHYNIEELINKIFQNIKFYLSIFKKSEFVSLNDLYINGLYRINKPSTFSLKNQKTISGFIRGVDDLGKLLVEIEDNNIVSFDIKEISIVN